MAGNSVQLTRYKEAGDIQLFEELDAAVEEKVEGKPTRKEEPWSNREE